MNWLQKISQLTYHMSILEISRLLEESQAVPDAAGQEYLFEGPEIAELRQLRNMPADIRPKLMEIIKSLSQIFEYFAERPPN